MSNRHATASDATIETLRAAIAEAHAKIDEIGRIADEAIADATKLLQQSSHIELKSPPQSAAAKGVVNTGEQ